MKGRIDVDNFLKRSIKIYRETNKYPPTEKDFEKFIQKDAPYRDLFKEVFFGEPVPRKLTKAQKLIVEMVEVVKD